MHHARRMPGLVVLHYTGKATEYRPDAAAHVTAVLLGVKQGDTQTGLRCLCGTDAGLTRTLLSCEGSQSPVIRRELSHLVVPMSARRVSVSRAMKTSEIANETGPCGITGEVAVHGHLLAVCNVLSLPSCPPRCSSCR